MSDNNQKPDAWGQNKNIPDSWGKNNKLPENWGKQSSNADNGTPSGGTKMTSSSSVENTANLSDKAKSGIGLLAGAAKKVGGAAKNAAGSAGAAMSNMKDKAASYAAEHKTAVENSTEAEYQEVPDYVASQEEHDRSVDEMIEEALAASGESPEGAEYDTVPEEQTVVDNTPVNAVSEPVTGRPPVQNDRYYEQPVNHPPVQNPGYYEQPVGDQMQLYGYKEKKSPVVYVMAGIIAVLLVGGGILGGMLLMKDKGNNGSDNSSNDEIITTTTEEKSNEANTASAQALTSEITAQSQEIITTSEATTEASKGEKVDTSDAVKRALRAHLDKEFANEKSQEYYYFDRDVKYAVYDVNADGVDELFISYDTTASHNTDVYIYKNNDYVLTEQVWEGGISVCLEEQFLFVQQYGGATVTRILNIYDGNLVQTDELILSASSYTHNGISITQNEYDKLLSNYQSKEMIELWNNTKPVSELIDISSYQKSNTQQKYTVYDTSAAGSDFEFYSDYFVGCKVATQSGTLNLRAAPSTTAEVIIQMPKDAYVQVLGNNADWDYVSYSNNGTTYYGYASREYIK